MNLSSTGITRSSHAALQIAIIDCLYTFGLQTCHDPEIVIDIVTALSDASEDSLLACAPGPANEFAPAEVGVLSELSERRAQVTRLLLLGGAASVDRRLAAGSVGVDIDHAYVAVRARVRTGCHRQDLLAELGLSEVHQPRAGLAAELDGDLIALMPAPLPVVTTAVVGVGPAAPPDQLVESFQLATRALDTARAFGLTGVHTFDDLGLLTTIVADGDIGAALWHRHLQAVSSTDGGDETLTALRTWLACDMHVDRAAAQMTMHPNTLRNRLARFEQLAGADLQDASTAMQVWWALHYAALADVGHWSTDGAVRGTA